MSKTNRKAVNISVGKIAIFPFTSEINNVITYDKTNNWVMDNIKKFTAKPNGETKPTFASGKILVYTSKTTGGQIDLEVYGMPVELKSKLRGQTVGAKGLNVSTSNDQPIYFGLAVEQKIKNDGSQEWAYFPKCILADPDDESETSEDKLKPQSDKISIQYMPATADSINKTTVDSSTADTDLDKSKMLDDIYLADADLPLIV